MKILVRAPMSEKRLEELKQHFSEVLYDPWNKTGERYYEDEMLAILKQVQPDILITELDRVSEKVLDGYHGLKVIGDCRAIPANIDVDACTKYGIPILCTPGRNAQAVAEMLVGLLITYMRNVIPSVQWTLQGKWKTGTTPYFTWMGNELNGKLVGFVGFGAVGKASAKRLQAFGCKICFYDPYVDNLEKDYKKMELVELFANCDIVSIHLPVVESTKHMINEELLALMKKDSIFINTARSAVVDMKALEKVAKEKLIKGIILDVLDNEPPNNQDLALTQYDNVLVTPHICGATYEVIDHQSDIINERLLKWKQGRDLKQIIYNPKVLEG